MPFKDSPLIIPWNTPKSSSEVTGFHSFHPGDWHAAQQIASRILSCWATHLLAVDSDSLESSVQRN